MGESSVQEFNAGERKIGWALDLCSFAGGRKPIKCFLHTGIAKNVAQGGGGHLAACCPPPAPLHIFKTFSSLSLSLSVSLMHTYMHKHTRTCSSQDKEVEFSNIENILQTSTKPYCNKRNNLLLVWMILPEIAHSNGVVMCSLSVLFPHPCNGWVRARTHLYTVFTAISASFTNYPRWCRSRGRFVKLPNEAMTGTGEVCWFFAKTFSFAGILQQKDLFSGFDATIDTNMQVAYLMKQRGSRWNQLSKKSRLCSPKAECVRPFEWEVLPVLEQTVIQAWRDLWFPPPNIYIYIYISGCEVTPTTWSCIELSFAVVVSSNHKWIFRCYSVGYR